MVQTSEFPFLPEESEESKAQPIIAGQPELEKLFAKEQSPSPEGSADKKGEGF